MSLKGKWTDKVDGVDDVLSEHINEIAHSVIELEKESERIPEWAKQPKKPEYTPSEVGSPTTEQFNALAKEVENIPEWARQSEKPKYTPEEVGAVSYKMQNLTDAEKAQARGNISAANDIVCSASGENVEITDSSDQSLHGLKIFGKSTQITTDGANLFPDSTVDEKIFTKQWFPSVVIPAGTYTLSYNIKSTDTDSDLRRIIIKSGDENLYYNTFADGDVSFTFTIEKPASSFQFYASSGSTASEGDTVILSNVMLNEGSTPLPYERYSGGVPAPNPDYPQDIISVGDKGEVNVSIAANDNLYGGEKLADDIVNMINSVAGETGENNAVKDSEMGTVTFPAKVASRFSVSDIFKPDTKYTFIIDGYNTINNRRTNLYIRYTDDTIQQLDFPYVSGGTIVYQSLAGKTVQKLQGTNQDGNTVLNYNKCGIFEGVLTADDFEPYKPIQTIKIPTPNGLRSVSGVCDEIDHERGVYVQKIGKIDSYAGESVGDAWISSTGELSTGATVVYQLSEPIETPLTEEELNAYRTTHTNKPNTIVSNDEGAEMEVSYAADTKLYIDNKFAEMAAAILNNA